LDGVFFSCGLAAILVGAADAALAPGAPGLPFTGSAYFLRVSGSSNSAGSGILLIFSIMIGLK